MYGSDYIVNSLWIHMNILILFISAALALDHVYDCPNASNVTAKDMDSKSHYQPKTTRNKARTMCTIPETNCYTAGHVQLETFEY